MQIIIETTGTEYLYALLRNARNSWITCLSLFMAIYCLLRQVRHHVTIIRSTWNTPVSGWYIRWTILCAVYFFRLVNYGLPILICARMGLWNWYSIAYGFFFMLGPIVYAQLTRDLYRHGKVKKLITTGWFRLCAHPYYTTWFLGDIAFWGTSLRTPLFIGSALLFYILFFWVCYDQEEQLMQLFGEQACLYYWRTPSVHALFWRLGIKTNFDPE